MGIPREEIPWFPVIEEDLCTACGNCLEFCSNGVFSLDDVVVKVVQPYNCVVGCDICAKDCPTEAIQFPEKKALVPKLRQLREKYSHSNLYKRQKVES